MRLLFHDGLPKGGQLFVLKLGYRMTDSLRGCNPQVIMGAGAFNAAHEADVAFVTYLTPTRPFQTSLKQIRLWELAHVIQIASIIQMVWAI